jgi:hypothetical protein
MVPDRSAGSSGHVETDEPSAEAIDDAAYDLVYRATRDAIWDVLGTATLILFHLVLAAISLSIAVGGIGPFLRGSASYAALGVGVAALAVGVFAAVRVYRLVTE